MKIKLRYTASALLWAAILIGAYAVTAQTSSSARKNNSPTSNNTTQAAGASIPVQGNGTLGRLPKWTGFSTSNSFIGDSTIFESKDGLVGIGTDSPASKLTIAGTLQLLSGGIKFADGTMQTTSALFGISHNSTLVGDGTPANPLGIKIPLVLSGSSASAILDVTNNTTDGMGIIGRAGNAGIGVYGRGGITFTDSAGTGVFGDGGDTVDGEGGEGVIGRGGFSSTMTGGIGVRASAGDGVTGSGGIGLWAIGGDSIDGDSTKSGGIGVLAEGGSGSGKGAKSGLAGKFLGDVQVTGTLSKAGGSFKIDHPLDPANKYLSHSFVESPDMMNIYNGNVTTNENGLAVIELPDYFDALNRDFRYQLTVVGQFAQAIVSEEVKNNRFTIQTSSPGVRVSWQVTGIRQDAWANRNRIPVEELKSETERGHYLHPEAFGQPEDLSVLRAQHPELRRDRKQHLPTDQMRERQQ